MNQTKPIVKRLIILSGVLLLLSVLLSCSAPRSGQTDSLQPITIRIAWWGLQPRHDYTIKVIELYEKLNKHVKISFEYASYDDYWNKLPPLAAANELPDIIQIDTFYYAHYAARNLLADLTPYLGTIIDVAHISPNAIEGGRLDNGIYGMNLGINALGFHYDPQLLERAGVQAIPENWTWDDYLVLADKAKQAGLYMDTGMRAEVFFAYYLRTQGMSLFNKEGTGLGYEEDQAFVDHFKRITGLVLNGSLPSPQVTAQVKGITDDPVVTGEAIGVWQWSNQFVVMQQVAKRDFAIAPMPGPRQKDGLFLKPSMFFSIANNSEVKEEAAKFINFFVNDVEANKLILGDRGVPVSSVVVDKLKETLDPAQNQVFDYITWAAPNSSPMDAPDPVGATEVFRLLTNLVEQMSYNKITPEVAAIIFRQEATRLLSQYEESVLY